MLKEKLLATDTKDVFADIARAHGLLLIILFGSVARGTETALSDTDIGVLGQAPLTHEEESLIAEEMAQKMDIPRIEVRSMNHASPFFLHQVMSKGIVLFADTETRAQELRLYAWKTATETRYLRDWRFAQTKKRIDAYTSYN